MPLVVPPVTTPVVPPTIYSGYYLLWNDEFNDNTIQSANWVFETGTGVNGDFGTGQLDRATERQGNAKIENGVAGSGGGCLAITTRKENYVDRQYTSARLTTQGKGEWGPGTRIEARIWPRDVLYKGQGFAFWMMPAEKPANQPYIMWPQGGEIDIMEYVGSIPNYNLGSVHYAWSWQQNQYQAWNHAHKGAYFSYDEKNRSPHPILRRAAGRWPPEPHPQEAEAFTLTGSTGMRTVWNLPSMNRYIIFITSAMVASTIMPRMARMLMY